MIPTWYDTEPAPVRAIIDLASMREPGADPRYDGVLALLLPDEAADTVREIAYHLGWIDRLGSELPRDVLSDYHEQPVHGIHLDRAADVLADELRASVVTSAQLVASTVLARRGRAA